MQRSSAIPLWPIPCDRQRRRRHQQNEAHQPKTEQNWTENEPNRTEPNQFNFIWLNFQSRFLTQTDYILNIIIMHEPHFMHELLENSFFFVVGSFFAAVPASIFHLSFFFNCPPILYEYLMHVAFPIISKDGQTNDERSSFRLLHNVKLHKCLPLWI